MPAATLRLRLLGEVAAPTEPVRELSRGEVLLRAISEVPLASVAWVLSGAVLAGIALFFIFRVHQRLWLVVLIPTALGASVMVLAGAVAALGGGTATVGSVLAIAPYDLADESVLRSSRTRWPRGAVVDITIPKGVSGVDAMPGRVYLPPQYFTTDGTLPVVFVVPPAPAPDAIDDDEPVRAMFDDGDLANVGAQAASNDKPVVLVVPAVSPAGEATQCIDSILGRWQTYLAEDVVAWAARQRRLDVTGQLLAIGGVEMGGYCAQITALRNPETFGSSGNVSGNVYLNYPGGNEEILGTGRGAEDVYEWSSPYLILWSDEPRSVELWMANSDEDPESVVTGQRLTNRTADGEGMSTQLVEVTGATDWSTWRPLLREWVLLAAEGIYDGRSSSSSSSSAQSPS